MYQSFILKWSLSYKKVNVFKLVTHRLEDSSTQPDVYEALHTAMKYPFRPGVAKVIECFT